MADTTTLLWLRQDLRLSDHPALVHAVERGAVVPVFILDPSDPWLPGGAGQWALARALSSLGEAFERRGAALVLRRGDPLETLRKLIEETGADRVVFSRRYEPYARAQESAIETKLKGQGIDVRSFNATLLFEPWAMQTKGGGPYKVYTPFAKACFAAPPPETPLPQPGKIEGRKNIESETLSALFPFLFSMPVWWKEMEALWPMSERVAQQRLQNFIDEKLGAYKTARDRPDQDGTSFLSAYLHGGLLSPRQVWHAVRHAMAAQKGAQAGGEAFLRQVLWREFCHHLLYHFPEMPQKPLQSAFARFPWREDDVALKAWQKGLTGYPIVDAGMRQLWRTGWMHNRVRMIVGSFLVKDLLLPWTAGQAWFWETLVDADLANNAAGWQWIAGCGADAAPYFRVFNPVLQGKKFDPDGAYVRRYVPELKGLTGAAVHAPWLLSEEDLEKSGVVLGQTYPVPLVNHAFSRERALAALKKSKKT